MNRVLAFIGGRLGLGPGARAVVQKVFSFGVAKASARGFNWLLFVTLPLLLSEAEYGVLGLVIATERLVAETLLVGQDRAVLRFYHDADRPGKLLGNALLIWFAAAVFALGAVLAVGMQRGQFLGVPAYPHLPLLCLSILLLNWIALFTAVLRVEQSEGLYLVYTGGAYACKAAVVLVFAYYLRSSLAYLIGLALALSIFAIAAGRGMWKRAESVFDTHQVWHLWGFGAPFIFHTVSGVVLGYIDRFMIEYYEGTAAVGVYTLAYAIGAAVSFIFAALATYFEPQIYRQAGDRDASERWLGGYSVACMVMAGLAGAALMAVLPFFVERLYDPAYYPAVAIVPVVFAGLFVSPLYRQANYRLTLYEKTGVLSAASVLAALLNVGANMLLIPSFGIWGAAVATLVTYAAFGVALIFLSLRYGRLPVEALEGKFVLTLAVGVAAVIPFLGNTLSVSLLLAFFSIASGWYVWACRPFSEDASLAEASSQTSR